MKEWKAGCADKPWKVIVAAQEITLIDAAIDNLVSTLTNCGSNRDAGLAEISEMTGTQIVSALLARRNACTKSVENALRGNSDE